MTEKSAPSGATLPACPMVEFDHGDLHEMVGHLTAVEDYLVAAEENAVKAFDTAAERGTPADRVTIDHLADTTSALHGVRSVLTSIDIAAGMSSLPGPITTTLERLVDATGLGFECIAENYEGVGFDLNQGPHRDANDHVDIGDFIARLLKDREDLIERINTMRSPETFAGINQEILRLQRKREDMARKAAVDAGLIAEEDLPSDEDAAHIFAAVGRGDWSNVSERKLRNLHIGTAFTMSPEDEELLREIQSVTDEAVAEAQRNDEDCDCEVDDEDYDNCKDELEWGPGKCNGTPAQGGPQRRSVIIRRGDVEVEIR